MSIRLVRFVAPLALATCLQVAPATALPLAIDCARSSRADEIAICGDDALLRADQQQAMALSFAMTGDDRSKADAASKAWSAERGRCASDKACIAGVQRKAIAALKDMSRIAPVATKPAAASPRAAAASDEIADFLKNNPK